MAVFPLQKDNRLTKQAETIYQFLKPHFSCEFDDIGNIGKMYRRQDEIGTPYCITVDFQSLEDNSVTVRNRDSMEQKRIKIKLLKDFFSINYKFNIFLWI